MAQCGGTGSPMRASSPSAGARLCACAAALVLLALAAPLAALDPNKAITQYMHDVWQTEQGLPQNSVTAIVQTRDGYLWLGTQEGLVRFDGVRFTVFDKKNTPELTDNFIRTLFEDKSGRLWVGTNSAGLVSVLEGRFRRFTTRKGFQAIRSARSSKTGVARSGSEPTAEWRGSMENVSAPRRFSMGSPTGESVRSPKTGRGASGSARMAGV